MLLFKTKKAAPDAEPTKRRRIQTLDTLRGVAVLYMVLYHTFFDLVEMFGCDWARDLFYAQDGISIWFTGAFILLGGVTIRFSHDPAIRGARLFFIAAAFTLVTAFIFEGAAIYFGVLHLFTVGMLLYAVGRPVIERIPAVVGVALCAVLFVFFYNISKGAVGFGGWQLAVPETLTYGNLLNGFGFINGRFSSVDYVPVLPWLFLFLAGCFAGRVFDRPMPDALCRDWCPPVTWCGRHSLAIYVLHQPLIFAVLFVLFNFILK